MSALLIRFIPVNECKIRSRNSPDKVSDKLKKDDAAIRFDLKKADIVSAGLKNGEGC